MYFCLKKDLYLFICYLLGLGVFASSTWLIARAKVVHARAHLEFFLNQRTYTNLLKQLVAPGDVNIVEQWLIVK